MKKLICFVIYLWCNYIYHCPFPKWMRKKVYEGALSRIKEKEAHCYMCIHIENSLEYLMGSQEIVVRGFLLPEFNRLDFREFLKKEDPDYFESPSVSTYTALYSVWLNTDEKGREWRIKFLEHIISLVS